MLESAVKLSCNITVKVLVAVKTAVGCTIPVKVSVKYFVTAMLLFNNAKG